MPDGAQREGRRGRSYIRWMLVLTLVVVAVDVGAAVLQIISNDRTDSARADVNAGLGYEANMGLIMQYTLDAETGQRGYLLTGEPSYLDPARVAVRRAPAVLQQIRAGSRGDPVLRRDYPRLLALLEARLRDLVATVNLYRRGAVSQALRLVKTNRGNNITAQVRSLVAAMSTRKAALVGRERDAARSDQQWASRASVAAYLASALLVVALLVLFRTYLVSEAARRESRLAQLEAERLNLAKSGFLSRVSHELRTPLNAILGFGQLLERDLIEQGERETLDQMLSAGRHLLAVVDDLLDLSRIEGGDLRLSLEPVQLSEALAETKSLISPTATAAAVGIRQRPVAVNLYVRADRQRLIQVLLNLVSNAVKYNRRGGNVVISAGRADNGNVRIEVADTGAGISAEAIDRLFTPFERLDAASRGIEGTGLGLALARGLVESMNGTLALSSEEGVGTTVSFELPLSGPSEVAQVSEPGPAAVEGVAAELAVSDQRLRAAISVLYIEDNPSNVRLVEKIFGLSGDLGLSVAHEGSAGVALARELRPDLILLDLHLPDMPGEQVLAAVRGDEELAATPVIIVSADASPVQAKRLLAAGANGYLTKPFDIDQLLAAVRTRGTPPPSAESAEITDAVLDVAMVASLHVLSANTAVGPGQIGHMLETFQYDARSVLSGVHEAVAEANLAAAEREAHRLAGGAGAVGAGRFRALCKELEAAARVGNLERCQALDPKFDELFEQTWDALASEFAAELRQVGARAERPSSG